MMEAVLLPVTEPQAKRAGTMNSTTELVGLDVSKASIAGFGASQGVGQTRPTSNASRKGKQDRESEHPIRALAGSLGVSVPTGGEGGVP